MRHGRDKPTAGEIHIDFTDKPMDRVNACIGRIMENLRYAAPHHETQVIADATATNATGIHWEYKPIDHIVAADPDGYYSITTPRMTPSYPARSFRFPCDILYALIACIDINNQDVPNHNNLNPGTGFLFVGRNPASLATRMT